MVTKCFHYSALFECTPELTVRVNSLQSVLDNYLCWIQRIKQ